MRTRQERSSGSERELFLCKMSLGQRRDASILLQRHTDNCHSVWKGKHTRADDLCDHERGDELWRAQVSVHSPHYISTEKPTCLPAQSLVPDIMLLFVAKDVYLLSLGRHRLACESPLPSFLFAVKIGHGSLEAQKDLGCSPRRKVRVARNGPVSHTCACL